MDQPTLPTQNQPKSNQKSASKKPQAKSQTRSKSKEARQQSNSLHPNLITNQAIKTGSEKDFVRKDDIERDLKKSDGKQTKISSMKAKDSAKLSHKQIEIEKSETNKAILKTVELSGRQIKNSEGNIGSNTRQYSAQNKKQDFPQIEAKKIKTQSKKAKIIESGTKSKTQTKDVKQEVQKTSIIGASKKSKRPSSPINELIEQKENEEEKGGIKSKKRVYQSKPQKLSLSKEKSQGKSKIEEKEEEKENPKKSKAKQTNSKAKSSKKSKASALKSKSESKFTGTNVESKSGAKKVKLNEDFADDK